MASIGLTAFAAMGLAVPARAGTDIASVVAATYSAYSVLAPTPSEVIVCHGFGCQYRSELGLSAGDRGHLAALMGAGRGSAAAERRAIGAAGAWFDRRFGGVAGTKGHVARANRDYMFDKRQMDCIDSSRNTTSLLLVLAQLNLLRFHDVVEPVARGFPLDAGAPHVTAVLRERATGVEWAVDSWTRAYGQAPEIMPLERWKTLD
ncbi:MAG: hypothetical protein GC182_18040 [Rhodopseudomonas sp.]|nr:hypothetical protein [Rhodopseudomonas sp.]